VCYTAHSTQHRRIILYYAIIFVAARRHTGRYYTQHAAHSTAEGVLYIYAHHKYMVPVFTQCAVRIIVRGYLLAGSTPHHRANNTSGLCHAHAQVLYCTIRYSILYRYYTGVIYSIAIQVPGYIAIPVQALW
jgi:hypothetical protein